MLASDDPPYRGIQVPLRFVKVVAWRSGDELATAGFLLDQSPVIDLDDPLRSRAGIAARERARVAAGATAVPDLGPFRTFQVPVSDVAAVTGLEMPALVAADRMPRALAAAGPREVTRPEDLLLGAR